MTKPTEASSREANAPSRLARRALCLTLIAAGCVAPEESPWGRAELGRVGVTVWPGLGTEYDVRGQFMRGEVVPGSGTAEVGAEGSVAGKFGLAGELHVRVWRDLSVGLGADYRRYDVEGLDPINSPDFVRVSVDTVDSLQYYLAARYELPPSAWVPSVRPYLQADVAYLPSFDFDYRIEFQGALADDNDDLELHSSGKGIWFLGLGGGFKLLLGRHVTAQVGAFYELPLTESAADLSFEVGELLSVPLTADLSPEGILFQAGLTLYL